MGDGGPADSVPGDGASPATGGESAVAGGGAWKSTSSPLPIAGRMPSFSRGGCRSDPTARASADDGVARPPVVAAGGGRVRLKTAAAAAALLGGPRGRCCKATAAATRALRTDGETGCGGDCAVLTAAAAPVGSWRSCLPPRLASGAGGAAR